MAAVAGAAVAKAVIPFALRKLIEKVTDRDTADKIENEAQNDPVVKNDLSAENPLQSRVVVGSIVAAAGVVLPVILTPLGVDIDRSTIVEFGTAAMTLAGAGYALYGRLKTGLKPLFSGRG